MTSTDSIAKAKEDGKSQDSPEPNKRWHECWKIIFFDENIFTVEAQFNLQNDRILAKSADSISSSINFVYCHQKPASVMVWAVISENRRSPLIFVKENAKLNTN